MNTPIDINNNQYPINYGPTPHNQNQLQIKIDQQPVSQSPTHQTSNELIHQRIPSLYESIIGLDQPLARKPLTEIDIQAHTISYPIYFDNLPENEYINIDSPTINLATVGFMDSNHISSCETQLSQNRFLDTRQQFPGLPQMHPLNQVLPIENNSYNNLTPNTDTGFETCGTNTTEKDKKLYSECKSLHLNNKLFKKYFSPDIDLNVLKRLEKLSTKNKDTEFTSALQKAIIRENKRLYSEKSRSIKQQYLNKLEKKAKVRKEKIKTLENTVSQQKNEIVRLTKIIDMLASQNLILQQTYQTT